MDGKSNGIGYSEKDNVVITDDVFRTVENNTMKGKYSSINGQLKIMNEQASESQKHGVEELDNLKTKVTDLSDSMGKMCTMCSVGWHTIGASCYYVSEEMRSWDEAQDECNKVNSFLVKIKDRNESDSLNALINRGRYYWIGLRRDAIDIHIWKWTDGTEVTFTNWGVNEPNFQLLHQHCGALTKGAWDDRICENVWRYICEKNRYC
ncbi:C-type lectin lectoxin-Phi1-like isoform X2 [Dendrobates tinctorius]|uniref:C-type lectin lectoxin-Phi1-like isoform X2 n=1 Tax=Dendrobates tinctorius TaxID=92724 RepID=UPI003CC966EA